MTRLSDQGSLGTSSSPSSSRGHIIGLSCEASGLLSPGQMHRASPGPERDATAIVDHVEDQNETHPSPSSSPSSSPSPELSNPNSIREAKDAQCASRRATHWKTVGMIIGFLFAALLSALGHYLLVKNLDGTLTDTAYLTQSQVSAVSILLTTIFKAALTASTGICFAQHLWFILRGNAMSLSEIEKLFVFRTNVLVLGDLRSIWRAPLLFLMALLVWSLGLATIYPPGALIVTFEAHNYTEDRNVSVMNPPVPQDLDIGGIVTFPNMGYLLSTYTSNGTADLTRSEVYDLQYGYVAPPRVLVNVAQSIIRNDQVFDLLVHPGENSTYNLQFRAPQFRCTVSQHNSTIPMEYTGNGLDLRLTTLAFLSQYLPPWDPLSLQVLTPSHPETLSYSVLKHEIKGIIVKGSLDNATTYEALVEAVEHFCKPYSMLYDVNISFLHGVRTINHKTSDLKAVPSPAVIYDDVDELREWPGFYLKMPAEPLVLEQWRQRVIAALPVFNEWAILDALGLILNVAGYTESSLPKLPDCIQNNALHNGTTVHLCESESNEWPQSINLPLMATVFDLERFNTKFSNSVWDPRYNLSITEDLLNSVLTNLTFSAISLGIWWDMVPVTTTRYRSTYSFTNPLNLILPYSTCLAAATLFAAIAIWSLWRNGIPAADGGFLQIMTATRGNTEMERLVLRERLITIENMSVELKDLRIRYGELVGEDVLGVDGRRLGFGTEEETVSLRKRK